MAKKFFTKESLEAFVDQIKAYTDKATSTKADNSHTHSIANVTNLQTALDAKVPTSRTVNGKALSANITLSKSDVGLGNVDNTADSAKSVKYATSAGSATKATQDASGNVITSTYETKTDATAKLTEAKTYADTAVTNVKNDLLNGAGTAYDTLKELGDLIDDNTDAIDALEAIAAGKQDKITGAASSIVSDNLTAARVLISNPSGKVSVSGIDSRELSYLDGVTSNIQTQLDVLASKTAVVTTSGSGAAYTATVSGMTLTIGASFVMIPHTTSTTIAPTLNVNGLGAKNVRRRVTNGTLSTTTGYAPAWLEANKPIRVTYDGEFWIADLPKPSAADMSGTLTIANGGTGADNVEDALVNLGAAPAEHSHSYMTFKNLVANLPVDYEWNCAAYGDGKFVAIADWSLIAIYSTDGVNWIETTFPTEAYWKSIAYGDGKFVAVGEESYTAYSTDGINWTATQQPNRIGFTHVIYGDGKFVATTDSGYNFYSVDGINWTEVAFYEAYYTSIAYGDGKFVAISEHSSTAAYSTDGINWTATELPNSESWKSIAYGDGKFVALGEYGSRAAYSTDGINWTTTETSFDTGEEFAYIAYGDGKFVALGEYGSTAAYSTDGINWTEIAPPVESYKPIIIYGDGKFIAIGTYTTGAFSFDGINWKTTYQAIEQDGTDITSNVKDVIMALLNNVSEVGA